MATAKRLYRHQPSSGVRRPRRGLARWVFPGAFPSAGLLIAMLAAAAWGWLAHGERLVGEARAATAYGARLACACRHISGRPLDGSAPGACTRDFVPGMALVFLSEDEEARSVSARVPLLHSHTATYREGFGCLLEPVSAR